MSPEIISMYRTPFMIFGVVLVLGTGHCFAEIPAILHNVSGEQENSCLMQINRGRGKSFGHLPFFNDIKCDHKLGRGRALSQPSLNFRAHPDTNILENTSMSQRIDAIPCKLCVVHSTTVMYTLVQEDGLGSRLTSTIWSLALAWNRSFSFGGFINGRRSREDKKEEKHQLLSALLGFDYEQLRPPLQRVHFGTCVGRDSGASGSRQLLRDLDRLPQGTKDVFLVATSGAGEAVLPPGFLQKWRAISGLEKVPATHFKKCGINIALHVRRGDVGQEMHSERFVTDEVNIQVAQTVQAILFKHSLSWMVLALLECLKLFATFFPKQVFQYFLQRVVCFVLERGNLFVIYDH